MVFELETAAIPDSSATQKNYFIRLNYHVANLISSDPWDGKTILYAFQTSSGPILTALLYRRSI